MSSNQKLIRDVSRRTVAKGLAWTVPTIAVASAAPAYAASRCVPTLRVSGGLAYNWGTLGAPSTTQSLSVGAQTYVDNLPAGVTVTQVTYEWWIANRIGQTSSGPGAFWVGNQSSNRRSENLAAMPYTPGAGTAWRNTVSNTQNLTNQVYPDGVTRQSWDLNFSWTAGTNGSSGTYTTDTDGCRDFTTGPSGRFAVTYSGVVPPRTCPTATAVVPNFAVVVVTLSDGQTLRYTSSSDGGSACR
ncbi:hypothetical protein [Kocuria sp.]|uniref:hypothetical protein n=1 Tax=Kocuria sp. TaxID=1871328 RepID=UPI0026E0EDF7|nr:hypothetical protein [Kocuria sp.]MDO5618760.1 hypothetical protein [Kocuria sp.]